MKHIKTGNAAVYFMIIAVLVLVGIFSVYYSRITGHFLVRNTDIEGIRSQLISSPTYSPTPEPAIPFGWETYKSSSYGFEISYPKSYKALDDKNNLYGWTNGIVLIYNGGQAYDIVIQHWDNEKDYQNRYRNQLDKVTVKQIDSKYITILNATEEPENQKVISTFKTNK